MPKVGMEPVRRQQLIDATIESVAQRGLQGTTINTISKNAGLQGLIEATVRYLLSNLKNELIEKVEPTTSAIERLMFIVEANFALVQQRNDTTRTWLSFWAQSMHDQELHRLQNVNSNRLQSNLAFSFKQLMPVKQAKQAAELSAAMIDGLWLRAVKHSETLAKSYVHSLIKQYGA